MYLTLGCIFANENNNADMKQGIRQIEISAEQRKQNESDYVQYDNDSDFVDVYFNPTTGGLKARHRKHKRTKGKEHFGLKPYELEDEFQNTIVEIGGACILLNEKMKRLNGQTARCLDALVNGDLSDIRTVTQSDTNIRNCITDKHKQLVIFNRDFCENASTMCLFYYDDSFYSDEKVAKAIIDYKNIVQSWPSGIAVRKILVVLRISN